MDLDRNLRSAQVQPVLDLQGPPVRRQELLECGTCRTRSRTRGRFAGLNLPDHLDCTPFRFFLRQIVAQERAVPLALPPVVQVKGRALALGRAFMNLNFHRLTLPVSRVPMVKRFTAVVYDDFSLCRHG